MTIATGGVRSWTATWPGRADSGRRLLCFPHAGAGATGYRTWSDGLPGVDVRVVRLPGRETRFHEPPYRSVGPLVEDLMDALAADLCPPFALFGHSMGALVAFELTRALRRTGRALPFRLIVSGRIAPQLRDPRPPLHTLPDGALVERLAELGGTPAAVLDDPAMRAMVLPLLRADFAVNETCTYRAEEPLAVPLTALCGSADPKVDVAEAAAWAAQTSGAFRLVVQPGGHFFPVENRESVLAEIAADLCRDLP